MIDFINYIRNRMSSISNSYGKKGTTVDEMVTKPLSIVISDFYNKLVTQKKINDVTQWESMTDSEMDSFGSKFFMSRKTGDFASTSLRIRFNKRVDILITDSIRAVAINGAVYKPAVKSVIRGESFKPSPDGYSAFFVDVQFIAVSKGEFSNVKSREIVRLENAGFDYVSVSNEMPVLGGSKHETNEEYFGRLVYTINDRSMATKSGVYSMLKESFPSVSSSYIASSGSRYMDRDIVTSGLSDGDEKSIDFKGKVPGDSSVKHYSASYIFPPKPGTRIGSTWGQLSSYSRYTYPMTLSPVNNTYSYNSSEDAALFGYDYRNEFDNDNYSGLYFNDYNKSSVLSTSPILDVSRDTSGSFGEKVLTPNDKWVAGANYKSNGDYGDIANGVSAIDTLYFKDRVITLKSGAKRSITTGYPTGKRVGIKTTGIIKASTDAKAHYDSNINIIVAGTDGEAIDSFNGIGFGIMIYDSLGDINGDDNAVVYFTHSNKFGGADVFINTGDIANNSNGTNVKNPFSNSISNVNSLKEMTFKYIDGASYSFEFTLTDNLELKLMLENIDASSSQDPIRMGLPSNVLSMFNDPDNGILSQSNEYYGSTVKVSLNTNHEDDSLVWEVSDLVSVDTNPGRPTSLHEFDVTSINTDIRLSLRAYATGVLNSSIVEGYTVYIWDKSSVNTIVSSGANNGVKSITGGWTSLDGVSNSDGTIDSSTGLLSTVIRDISRYTVNTSYGKKMYIMIVPTGESAAPLKYNSRYLGNRESILKIDYIKIEPVNEGDLHTNDKSDVYVVTSRSGSPVTPIVAVVPYNVSYAELSSKNGIITPINRIISVSSGSGDSAVEISPSDYSVYAEDINKVGSVDEVYRVVINSSYSPSDITVLYSPYPDILLIQEYFSSGAKKALYGDILVKHKYKVALTFSVQYSGRLLEVDAKDFILNYIDNNNSSEFNINSMISSMYDSGEFNNVVDNIEVIYTRTYDDGLIVSGTFTTSLAIKDIEFFEADSITVSRL